jgi:rubrerythrin
MESVKNTSFLDAVAAGIQHEKDFFDFCMKTQEELLSGPIKDFLFDLAEDSEEHIRMIEGIYKKFSGGSALPNLKHLGQVHKFQSTSIQKLFKKLDRNLKQSAKGSEIEALRLALQETQDAVQAFGKLAQKFADQGTKILFQQMANFNKERAVLLEGSLVFQQPHAERDTAGSFHEEAMSITLDAPKKPVAKPKSKAKPAKAKKKPAVKKKAAKKPKTKAKKKK